MYNPFVGNYILDAFTTEVGGELYLRAGPWLAIECSRTPAVDAG